MSSKRLRPALTSFLILKKQRPKLLNTRETEPSVVAALKELIRSAIACKLLNPRPGNKTTPNENQGARCLWQAWKTLPGRNELRRIA